MLSRLVVAAIAFVAFTCGASAQNYDFYLHNRSNGWVINGFYTQHNGRWSNNWLNSRVSPGRNVAMHWDSQSGACRVQFRVSWVDWGTQDFTMDWCANNPSNVYMKDQGFTWD